MTQIDADEAGQVAAVVHDPRRSSASSAENLAVAVLPRGSWTSDDATDSILIDFDQRFRRRIRFTTVGKNDILLDLPQAVRLRDGDGLRLANGTIILISARPEALNEVSTPDAATLVRIAWHLGNRHLPVQFVAGRIRFRADHVIADMVAGLGGQVRGIEAPFDPEAGAYAAGATHHHHADDHDP